MFVETFQMVLAHLYLHTTNKATFKICQIGKEGYTPFHILGRIKKYIL